MICPQCGYENPPIANYCGKCGTPQTEAQAQQLYQKQTPPSFPPAPVQKSKGKGVTGLFIISPFGALLAIICFMFPWIEVNCAGKSIDTKTGFDIAFHDEKIFIVVLGLAAIIIVAGLIFKFIKKPIISLPITLASAIASLVIMGLKYNKYIEEYGKEIFKVKFGAVGTVLGFVIAILGSFLLFLEKKE